MRVPAGDSGTAGQRPKQAKSSQPSRTSVGKREGQKTCRWVDILGHAGGERGGATYPEVAWR